MSVMRNVPRIAAVLLLATAVVACGGGGSKKTSTAPVTPTNPPIPPPPPPPPPLPTSDPASGFTFDFRQYSPIPPVNEARDYARVASGDFNGDGRDDVVAILGQNELHVLLQKADGTLAEPWIYAGWLSLSWAKLVQIADFDNDGADDIAFDFTKDAHGAAWAIVRWQSGEAPGFVMEELTSLNQYQGPPGLLALDFNGDGNVDMVEINNWTGDAPAPGNCSPSETCPHIVVYPGDGAGQVGEPQYRPWSGAPQSDARDFFVQDIDMDGRDDVVFMSMFGYPQQTKLYGMKRKADGSLENPKLLVDMNGVDAPAFFGDLNSDGRTDLIYADVVHFRDASGAFQAPVGLGLRHYMDAYWNVLGDFDGNGQTDIVNRQFERFFTIPYFTTYLQKNGTVQAPFFRYDPPTNHTVNPAKWDRHAFATGDFNGDGCLDIAVANQADGILFVEGQNCIVRPN